MRRTCSSRLLVPLLVTVFAILDPAVSAAQGVDDEADDEEVETLVVQTTRSRRRVQDEAGAGTSLRASFNRPRPAPAGRLSSPLSTPDSVDIIDMLARPDIASRRVVSGR